MKKLLLLSFVCIICISQAFTQSGNAGPLTWEIVDGTLTISGSGDMPDYGCGGAPWHQYHSSITTVVIEDGVTKIGKTAFCEFKIATSITIANTVESIGMQAFLDCFILPEIILPTALISIGDGCFSYCDNITSITIPALVANIGDFVFGTAKKITSINVDPNNLNFSSENGVLFNKTKTTLLTHPPGKTEPYIVPSGVTTIATSAFYYCRNLKHVTLPNSLTTIGPHAFNQCRELTSIMIPNSVNSIGISAFTSCHKLTSIIIPPNVTTIETQTFYLCPNLTSVVLPASLESINHIAFYNCPNLTSMIALSPQPAAIVPSSIDIDRSLCTLTVLNSAMSVYQNTPIWNEFNIVGGDFLVKVFPDNTLHGNVDGTGLYNANATATVNAIANQDYKFINWTKNGTEVSQSASYSFTVTEDVDLVANFELKSFTVNASPNNPNYGQTTGSGTYDINTTATVDAIANQDYRFVNWTVNGVEVSQSASYSFTVTENVDIVANFSEIQNFLVSAVPNNVNYGQTEGSGSYELNEVAVVTASANYGYNFVSWTVNDEIVSQSSSYSFIVTQDIILIANFEAKSFTVYASPNNVNYGQTDGSGSYDFNTTATVTATANQNYRFVNWTVNNIEVSQSISYSFTVTEDVSIVANFTEIHKFWINVAPNNANYGQTDGSGSYYLNETATVNARANAGYVFINWTINNEEVSQSASYSFIVTEDVNIIANFIKDNIGINDLETSIENISIYPNPTQNIINISAEDYQIENIEIFNLSGRKFGDYNQKQIDISHLPAGVYFMKITTDGGSVTKKIVKE